MSELAVRFSPSGHAASAGGRSLAGLTGVVCAALATWLALHHPLSPAVALTAVGLLAALQAAWPPFWLVALPALLPWLGLGAWSGWFVVEEMDLAVLAIAGGAYLRWCLQPGPRVPAGRRSRRQRAIGTLLLLLWTVSVLVALLRGVADAGGWIFSWWQGWREPLNALRVAKPTLAAWLLLPLWWRLQQRMAGERCADLLGLGMVLGLAGMTAWCAWERWVFTGLLNMATDYRTTGPFWETHTGGAALDASLALMLPFALYLLRRARRPAAMVAAAVVLLGGLYAGLTAFSRILLLALPAGALLFWWLMPRNDAEAAAAQGSHDAKWAAGILCLGMAALGAWMFPTAGYRGALALLGCALSLLLLVPRTAGHQARDRVLSFLLGIALAAPVLALAWLVPKGAYLAYGSVACGTWALLLFPGATPGRLRLATAGFLVQLACMAMVAVWWGGAQAAPASMVAASVLCLAWLLLVMRPQPPWPATLRWFGSTAVAMVAVLVGVAVFTAGDYMSSRLAHAETDRDGRWSHWRDGLALNTGGAGLWLGRGLGRYADLYALHNRIETRPGDVRLVTVEGAAAMRLVAGQHMLGHGELLRLSQRVPAPSGSGLVVSMQVRSQGAVSMHAELCSKHLLYEGGCRVVQAGLAAAGTDWRTLTMRLPDGAPATGNAPPTFIVFSLATQLRGQPLDLRSVTLTDASGRQWLRNGDFSDGGAHWFITSDRNHLPWHAKNLAVHLWVEQGILGLVALAALTLAALWSVTGPLRWHPLAPVLGAALVGCWVVGGVDSVLDMPRVATWLLVVSGMALNLHLPGRRSGPAQVGAHPRG